MKTLKTTVMACLSALVLSGTGAQAGTAARDHGKDYSKNPIQPAPEICGPWFTGFSAGVWWVQDYGVNVPFVGVAGDHVVNFDTGFAINVTPIGYRFSDMASVSLETGFYQAGTNSVTLPAGLGTFGASDGQLRLFPIMTNINLTFPVANHLNFYAGFGAGLVYRELEASVPGVALLASFHDSGWDTMLQARAGLAYEFAQCMFLNLGYRYNHVFTSPEDINGHMLELGFTIVWR